MAHFKLTDADDHFLQVPQDAVLIFAGASGTETWIERTEDVTVRLVVKSVAMATADGATGRKCRESSTTRKSWPPNVAPARCENRRGLHR